MNHFQEDLMAHSEKSDQQNDNKSRYPGQRILAFLLFLGAVNAIALRLNLSIAVVEMTSNKTIIVNNQTIYYPADFQWDSNARALVMSSFYYGHLLSPIGGYISRKWGGIRTYSIALLVTAIFTITTPISLRLNFYWFIFCRILEGVTEAIIYTSLSEIWSKWSAPEDRSKFMSITSTGYSLGAFVTFPICGYIAHKFGWQFIFYVTGSAAIVWYMVFVKFTPNGLPSQTHFIRKADEKKVPYPLKKIITSKSVLTLNTADFTFGWSYNLISVCLPLYVKDISNTNINENGMLSSIPNLMAIFIIPLTGYSVDLCINNKWMTSTKTHKLFNVIGFLGGAMVVISIAFTRNFNFIMVYLTLFRIFVSFNSVIIQVMPLYIAPECPSFIAGVNSVYYTIGNMMVPIFIGYFVTENASAQWSIIFISTGVIMVISGIISLFFSSSEPQPWGISYKKTDQNSLTNHE